MDMAPRRTTNDRVMWNLLGNGNHELLKLLYEREMEYVEEFKSRRKKARRVVRDRTSERGCKRSGTDCAAAYGNARYDQS